MDPISKGELLFVLAKFLQSEFPSISETFIHECESRSLFPPSIFTPSPTFADLNARIFQSVSSDQLLQFAMRHISEDTAPLCKPPLPSLNLADSLFHSYSRPGPQFCHFSASQCSIGHFGSICCLALHPTSQLLASASQDLRLKLWKTPELVLIQTLQLHTDLVCDLSFHPTSPFLATASHDHTSAVINVSSGILAARFIKANDIQCARFSPCGRWFAIGCDGGLVEIWNADRAFVGQASFVSIQSSSHRSVMSLNFSQTGDFVVFSADPNAIQIAKVGERTLARLVGHAHIVDFVIFGEKNEETVLSLSRKERCCRMWVLANGKWEAVRELCGQNQGGGKVKLLTAAFNCTERLVVASTRSSVIVWEVATGLVWCEFSDPELTQRCCLARPHPSEPGVVAVATEGGSLSLWDISCRERGERLAVLSAQDGVKIVVMRWSFDGAFLVCSTSSGKITLYSEMENPAQIPVTEMFFRKELSIESMGDEIVDHHGEALVPQPRRFSLARMRFELRSKSDCSSDSGRDDFDTASTIVRLPTLKSGKDTLRAVASIQDSAGEITSALPECCFWTERFMHSVIPQIGEHVIYLRAGHMEWRTECSFRDLPAPFELHPDLPPVAPAVVQRIEFFVNFLIIELSFDGFSAKVAYPIPECPPFIVPSAHFERSLDNARKLSAGQLVTVYFQDDDGIAQHHGEVLDCPVIEPDPYNSIQVRFTDDLTIGSLHPWEVIFAEEPDDDERSAMKMCDAVLKDIRGMIANEAFAEMRSCRSNEWRRMCLRSRLLPMDLELIAERLRRHYYLTSSSLLADVRQLQQNARIRKKGRSAARSMNDQLAPKIRAAAVKAGLESSADDR